MDRAVAMGMAAQPPQSKSISRWGSLLQQAMAGVESRLDNILADDDSSTTVTIRTDAIDQPGQRAAMTIKKPIATSSDVSRQLSVAGKNGRLQERLARAVITHNSANSGVSSGPLSQSTSPNKAIDDSHRSMDSQNDGTLPVIDGILLEAENLHGYESAADQLPQDSDITISTETYRELDMQRTPSVEAIDTIKPISSESLVIGPNYLSTCSSLPETHSLNRLGSTLGTAGDSQPTMQSEAVIDQMRANYEAVELRRQDETHRYLQHIEFLQAKLQFLTREATILAKKTKSEAEADSVEQMLATKDEKIVLLVAQGQELAQNELKYTNTIRKLRARILDDAKSLKDAKRVSAELEKAKSNVEECAREAEDFRRKALRQQETLRDEEIQLRKAKLENDRRAMENADLQQQLSDLQIAGGLNEVMELKRLLEAQKKRSSELQDDLSNAQLERKLADERHQGHVRELQEKIDRGNEKAKVNEIELRSELVVFESRFESLRARAEDISSGGSGDAQSKLLRQIETLQTQYAVASENWRGIEDSLLARIASLESGRDDVAKREGDNRRKARVMVNQCRQLEIQKEEASNQIQDLEKQVKEQKAQLAITRHFLSSKEAEIVRLQNDLASERENWQARLKEKLEIVKKELQSQSVNIPAPPIRTDLPVVQNRQKWQPEKASPHGRRHQGGSGLGLVNAAMPSTDRPLARQHSSQAPQCSESGTPHRPGSLASTPQPSFHNGVSGTPSSETYHQEDFFDGVVKPATPERTINDMFSASTAAAGPSVQLVERMSAAVRRLESEKSATRDDLDRLLAQRDEAREQVVKFMREVEKKLAADAKISKLEAEVEEINQRYQTTLEMLGEKSEMVDELQADIGDVKQMYRDLVNSTMR